MFGDTTITSLCFSSLLVRLKSIAISAGCFKSVRDFSIDGLKELESVKIGGDCFRSSYEEHKYSACHIANCPSLRKLEISTNSFVYFDELDVTNVNSLEVLSFGSLCFQQVKRFVLTGLDELKRVVSGPKCSKSAPKENGEGIFCITDHSSLRQLILGSKSFPLTNEFQLSNVNSLQSIKFGPECFMDSHTCVLKGEFENDGLCE